MKNKSPFLIFEGLIPPKYCEMFVNGLGFFTPDTDKDGTPIKMARFHTEFEETIFEAVSDLVVPEIEQHYEVEYRGTEQVIFEYLATGTQPVPICDNSDYLRKKWVRTKDRDFTCILFLVDHNDQSPFDGDYEVSGGKLEFPQHQFSFNPSRGTLIVYPSGPHFINACSEVVFGDLYQARIHIATMRPFLYDPSKFPGDYTTWFKEYI